MEILIVGAGGFLGAIARYLVYLAERSFGPHTFPFGTLGINVLGCLCAGFMLAAVERDFPLHKNLILLISMGFLGSFTTFSAFSVETLQLIRSGHTAWAAANVSANTIFGVGAVWFGRFLIFKF